MSAMHTWSIRSVAHEVARNHDAPRSPGVALNVGRNAVAVDAVAVDAVAVNEPSWSCMPPKAPACVSMLALIQRQSAAAQEKP